MQNHAHSRSRQSPALAADESVLQNGSDEEMDESNTLANSKIKITRHRNTPRTHWCCCQYILRVIVLLLLATALFLIYDYRAQQQEIGNILSSMTRNGVKFNEDASPPEKVSTENIDKVLWIFEDESVPVSQKWFRRRITLLAKRAAEQKGLKLIELTDSSWKQYLPPERAKMLAIFVDALRVQKTHDKTKYSDLTPQIAYRITKQLIALEILYRNGGIYVDSNALLTQGLKWIDEIEKSAYINTANRSKKPDVVAFYSPSHSPAPQKQAVQAQYETQKYIVRYPTLRPFFLYTVAYSNFVKDMLTQFYYLIQNADSISSISQSIGINLPSLNVSRPMSELFELCSQLTLRKKEKELSKLNDTTLSISFYNIITINENFGPNKLNFMLGSTSPQAIYRRLSYMTLIQLQEEIGHLHFLVLIPALQSVIPLFEQSFQQNLILKNSFIAEYILDSSLSSSTFELKYKRLSIEINKWDSFPKKVWTYFTGFQEESSLLLQYWVQHMRERAFKSGFTFTILTERNLQKDLSAEAINLINEASKQRKGSVYTKVRSELISLAILSEVGGVWIQPLTILSQNLNWVVQTYKDFKMWNRLDVLPKVLLNFNPRKGGVFDWIYNQQANNTRVAWNLGFYNNLMCSEKNSVLMTEWFKEYIANLKLSNDQVENKFALAAIKQYQWSRDNSEELLMLDTLKCLLAQKQKELQQKNSKNSSVGYYGLWAVNGLMGQLKFSEYTNFMGESSSNCFFWRYSQQFVEAVIGKVYYPLKLHDQNNYLEEALKNNYRNLSAVIDSNSLFMKYLYRPTLKIVDDQGILMLQNNAEVQPWISLPKIVWVFHVQETDSQLTKRCLKNIQRYCDLSKYELRLVTYQNYYKWLSVKLAKQIEVYLKGLDERASKQKSNLNDHLQNIKQRYIMLHLLKQYGGIIAKKQVLLVQNLNWLNTLQKNAFLNRGSKTMPEVFGFFAQGYSSRKEMIKAGRLIVKYPSLESDFIAATKEANFIIEVLAQYKNILQQPFKVKKRMSQMQDLTQWLHGDDPYYESFFLACHLTLRRRQQMIDELRMGILAIDYYCIYSMNSYFYPNKLLQYFQGKPTLTVMQHFVNITLEQLEARTGPLHFFILLPKREDVNKLVEEINNKDPNRFVLEKSLIHRLVFLNDSAKGVIRNDQRTGGDEKAPSWTSLPRNVWYYQAGGRGSLPVIKQMVVLSNKLTASTGGFVLRQINDKNVKKLLNPNDYASIAKILQFQINEVHKPHLYSLGVLVQHGGVFLTANHVLLDGLQGIVDIARYQKSYIYNRFGEVPETLITFNTLNGSNNYWIYDDKQSTKIAKRLNYSIDFIAANQQANFTRDWFDELINQIRLEGTSQQLAECDPQLYKLYKMDKSLLVYDALYCILFKKQKLIKDDPESNWREALAYYRLWSTSQSNGLDKLESQLYLDRSEWLNTFIWQYPQDKVEFIIGKLGSVVFLSNQTLLDLEKKVKVWKQGSWGHTYSLAERLHSKVRSELVISVNGQISLIE